MTPGKAVPVTVCEMRRPTPEEAVENRTDIIPDRYSEERARERNNTLRWYKYRVGRGGKIIRKQLHSSPIEWKYMTPIVENTNRPVAVFIGPCKGGVNYVYGKAVNPKFWSRKYWKDTIKAPIVVEAEHQRSWAVRIGDHKTIAAGLNKSEAITQASEYFSNHKRPAYYIINSNDKFAGAEISDYWLADILDIKVGNLGGFPQSHAEFWPNIGQIQSAHPNA